MLCLLPTISEPNLLPFQKDLLIREVSLNFLSGICHSEIISCFFFLSRMSHVKAGTATVLFSTAALKPSGNRHSNEYLLSEWLGRRA